MFYPLKIWLNVIDAILIRDVKVRAGPFFSGYLFIFFIPFLHLFVVIVIFSLLDKVVPFGNDRIIYFSLSILPFVIFVYPSQQIMRSIVSNAPLLYFSRVKLFDIIFARGILEILNGLSVSFIIILVVFVLSSDFNPENGILLIASIGCTLIFGFAMGSLSALIAQILPMWVYTFSFIYPIFWIFSGIIFNPHAVPDSYIFYLKYNPLLICVESMRYAYYYSYPDNFFRLEYVLLVSFVMFSGGILIERLARRRLITS